MKRLFLPLLAPLALTTLSCQPLDRPYMDPLDSGEASALEWAALSPRVAERDFEQRHRQQQIDRLRESRTSRPTLVREAGINASRD